MGRTAFIFPGQGSQYAGMGRLLWESDEDVRRLYSDASDRVGMDVADLSLEGEGLDSEIGAQIAVYVCNEAYRITLTRMGFSPDVVTGYSLGFYSALVAAGCIDFFYGLDAVRKAGELAVEQSARQPGTMGAVIGLSVDATETLCRDASDNGPVFVSNVNAARQVLVSGSVAGVRAAVRLAAERGALKAYELEMGAAYHSPVMDGVAREFSLYAGSMPVVTPSVPLMSYIEARYLTDTDAIRDTVGTQIARRVLWRDTVHGLIADGVDRFIEVGPGEALTRMVRWVDRGVNAVSADTLIAEGATTFIDGRAGDTV